MTALPPLTLYLAAPRGFCAGVDRAIKIVEMAIEKWGAPVYVRHEIVHNRYVVDGLRDKGAVFVEELSDAPDDRPKEQDARLWRADGTGEPLVLRGHEALAFVRDPRPDACFCRLRARHGDCPYGSS